MIKNCCFIQICQLVRFLQKSKILANLKSQPSVRVSNHFSQKISFRFNFQIKMYKSSTIAAAVAFHLSLAFLMTFNQFTMSSLMCLLLNIFILSEGNQTGRPGDICENWFRDFMALFFVFEFLVTFCWGATETLIRLGLNRSTVFTNAGPETQHILMQLIPTIIILSLYYWPQPCLENCCTKVVGAMSEPLGTKTQSTSPVQKTTSASPVQATKSQNSKCALNSK